MASVSAPWIWNGLFGKSLRSFLNINDTLYILQGTDDPTVVAKNAPLGSMYFKTGGATGETYIKQDNGSTTNWKPIVYAL